MAENYYDTISGEGPKRFSVSPNLTDYEAVYLPPDFDHLSQRMFFALNNGSIRSFDFNQLDDEMRFGTQWSVVYGVVIGMSIMTLLHVVALTPSAKRRTVIYWMNIIGLCLVFVRGIFQALFFRDRWASFYVMFSGDAETVPVLHRFHLTVSTWLGFFGLMMVEVIFFIQGRAIMNSLHRRYYYPVMGTMLFVALVSLAMKVVTVAYGMKDIWIWRYVTVNGSNMPLWLDPANLTTYVVSIGLWSVIWSCFIGRQILLRWQMKMIQSRSFTAMNVLFIAGIQSMIIPMFFLSMQFVPYGKSFWGAESMVVPSILCLMPFSCLWAGTISSRTGQGCDDTDKVGHGMLESTTGRFALSKKGKSEQETETTTRNLSGDTAAGFPASRLKRSGSNHLDKLYPTHDTSDDSDDIVEESSKEREGSSHYDSSHVDTPRKESEKSPV